MKIIMVDNFDRDTVSDELIAIDVSKHWSKRIAGLLNAKYSGNNTSIFFKSVSDDHELYVGDFSN